MEKVTNIKKISDKPDEYVIGQLYHCDWAKSKGFVWRLLSFDLTTGKAQMETPKTYKPMETKLSSLRLTNEGLKNKITKRERANYIRNRNKRENKEREIENKKRG